MNFVDSVNGDDFVRVILQFGQGHRGDEFLLLCVISHPREDLITILLGLRDVFLRLADAAVQTGNRRWKSDRRNFDGGHEGKGEWRN